MWLTMVWSYVALCGVSTFFRGCAKVDDILGLGALGKAWDCLGRFGTPVCRLCQALSVHVPSQLHPDSPRFTQCFTLPWNCLTRPYARTRSRPVYSRKPSFHHFSEISPCETMRIGPLAAVVVFVIDLPGALRHNPPNPVVGMAGDTTSEEGEGAFDSM